MRVVAGSARGMRLLGPPESSGRRRGGGAIIPTLRPTSDRVRESLFAILGDMMIDRDVLDAFAGCGTLGIEALSRGAKRCAFLERDRRAQDILRRNLDHTRMADRAHVIGGDALRSIDTLGPLQGIDMRFGLLLFDPPYDLLAAPEGWRDLAAFVRALAEADLLEADALIVVEHRTGDRPAVAPDGLAIEDERRYGDTSVTLFQVGKEPQTPRATRLSS